MTHHVHPSLLRCRRPPPAASGPAAAASPSCAIEVARPASFWPRRGLPRSENEPAPDSEIDVRFDAPDAARRSPNHPAGPSANHPKRDTTIKWAGGVRERRPRRGNTRQYAMNCNLGDILLRRPGDMPLLGRRQICNNTLCPCDVGCVIWSDFDHEGACVSFLRHDSNDTGSSGDRPAQPLSTPNTARF